MGRTLLSIAIALVGLSHARAQSLDFLDVPDRPMAARGPADPAAVRGLLELEDEMGRLEQQADGYRSAVRALTARRLREMRRQTQLRYDAPLRVERRLHDQATDRARIELESFLRAHPRDDGSTADAMLRLGELYVLRSLDEVDRGARDTPDFTAAIDLATRILREHASSRFAERAAYLLGYVLAESGRTDEALAAWRGGACPSRFGYFDAVAAGAGDPYADCPARAAAPLAAEMWLRIGEQHFEAGDGQLDAAIGAYRHVIEQPADRLFDLGLYKLAWTYYRAERYPEAIERFAELVARSDAERTTSGRAGSELRAEALEYIAISLAYDDWNEDGVPDHEQGGATPVDHTFDPALIAPTASFALEVQRRVGEILFEQAHYEDAIAVWRRAMQVPERCDAAEIAVAVARAYRRLGDEEAASRTLLEMVDAETQPRIGWHGTICTNTRETERLMERALVSVAQIHHQRAQVLRRAGSPAQDEYDRAIRAYRAYVERYPNSPDAYALRYDLGDALYWSGRYEEAAREYAAVRGSNYDDRLLAASARRVVESLERLLEQAIAEGRVQPRTELASAPEEVPELLQRVGTAREIYVRWIEDDSEHVAAAYAYNNALLVARYGFAAEARARFEAIYRDRCRGERASDVGREAWLALRDAAVRRRDLDELERLTGDLRERACTFRPDGAPVLADGCREPGSLSCEVEHIETSVGLGRLEERITRVRAMPPGEPRRAEAARVAASLVESVDRAPQHPDAALALSRAAHLLQDDAARSDAAEEIYRRIVDRVHGEDEIVADARLQLARIAQHAWDVDAALAGYRALARTTDPRLAEIRRSARVDAALLATHAGRHAEAVSDWTLAAEQLSGVDAREARFHAAEERLLAGDARAAATALDAWLRSSDRVDALAIRAHSLRARAAELGGDAAGRLRELDATVAAYRASGLARESAEAGVAAQAALTAADLRAAAYRPAEIHVRSQETMQDSTAALARAIRSEGERVRALLDGYDAVVALGRATESVAALERQGALQDRYVQTALAAHMDVPRQMVRQFHNVPRSALQEAIDQQIGAALEPLVQPIECRAIERYLLASRLARRHDLSTPAARRAIERLQAYGAERVAQCASEARERDATFAPFDPAELDRARPGLEMDPPRDSASRLDP